MNDLLNAGIFFLIFAVVLAAYGFALAKTGNVELLPSRARHSIRGRTDVEHVGRIVVAVAAAIGAASLLVIFIAR